MHVLVVTARRNCSRETIFLIIGIICWQCHFFLHFIFLRTAGLLVRKPLQAARAVHTMATDDASLAELQAVPGVAPSKDPETEGYKFQQTMLRIKDPKRSLDFYTRVLGMNLITKLDFPTMKFSLYFLAFVDSMTEVPDDPKDRTEMCFGRC